MKWRRNGDDKLAERTLETIPSDTAVSRRAPTDQELASIVAIVLVSDSNASQLAERLRLTPDETQPAIDSLLSRGAVFDSGGGFYQTSQGACAGGCGRPGHALRGQEVVIDPTSSAMAWWCSACWKARSGAVPTKTDRRTTASPHSDLHSRAAEQVDRRQAAGSV